ncbi:putative polyketide biosynthesis zinc-dependent hydrolase BaeB [termite gut metagenome]|uniref:Putative polyketide biosynthesis zinc-dependent hydrolase BaeB n=1 Tax=termite gut metagenome TaxID=433724 RepID=A0A5J4SPE4_9ZZZZ
MLVIERFINELMTSNCYIIHDNTTHNCIIVDPGTENCKEVIEYVDKNKLNLDYILLTHEHTDHTWGCNTLIDKYNSSKIICSQICKDALPKEGRMYFQFYYDNPDYEYAVKRVDIVLEDIGYVLKWDGYTIHFISTPGHSDGSICFSIENNLFTGDTIMQYKPVIPKKNGSLEKFKKSVNDILNRFSLNSIVYPGHGELFYLREYSLIV